MTGKDIFMGLRYIDSTFIHEAEFASFPAEADPQPKTIPLRRLLLIAAILAALLAISLTAYAADWFGIRSMITTLADSQKNVMLPVSFGETNEFKAAAEWLDYQTSQLGKKRTGSRNLDKSYTSYNCINEADKKIMDAILEKYHLKLHREGTSFHDRSQEELYDLVGISDFLPPSIYAGPGEGGGHVRDGSTIVSYDDGVQLPNGKQVNYSLDTSTKGYLNGYWWNEADFTNATEWHYTTAKGTSVTLCQDETLNILLLDMDHCFLFLSVHPIGNDWSRQDLESFADLFDFEKLKGLGA